MPPMKFSPLLDRISGASADAWEVSDRATMLLAKGHDIIHLGVGDPDLDADQVIQRAASTALASGRTHYSPLGGEPALRQAIATHAGSLYGIDVDPAEVAVCSGAQGALFSVFQLIAGHGDEVIVLSPYYATYPAVVSAGGAAMVTVELPAERGFHLEAARRQDRRDQQRLEIPCDDRLPNWMDDRSAGAYRRGLRSRPVPPFRRQSIRSGRCGRRPVRPVDLRAHKRRVPRAARRLGRCACPDLRPALLTPSGGHVPARRCGRDRPERRVFRGWIA